MKKRGNTRKRGNKRNTRNTRKRRIIKGGNVTFNDGKLIINNHNMRRITNNKVKGMFKVRNSNKTQFKTKLPEGFKNNETFQTLVRLFIETKMYDDKSLINGTQKKLDDTLRTLYKNKNENENLLDAYYTFTFNFQPEPPEPDG